MSGNELVSVLTKLTIENFSVSDDTILDKLYIHIERNLSLRENVPLLLPAIGDWLEDLVNRWKSNEITNNVKSFSIRFIGYIGTYVDGGFNMLKQRNVLNFLQDLTCYSAYEQNSPTMVPLINVFCLFLQHKEGWKWINDSVVWVRVVEAYYNTGSIYTKRQSTDFISLMAMKSTIYDLSLGKEILELACKPLISSNLLQVEVGMENSERCFDKSNCATDKSTSGHQLGYTGEKVVFNRVLEAAAKFMYDILYYILSQNCSVVPLTFTLICRPDTKEDCNRIVIASDILDSCTSPQVHTIFASMMLIVEVYNFMTHLQHQNGPGRCPISEIMAHFHRVIASLTSDALLKSVPGFCTTTLSWIEKLRDRVNFGHTGCDHIPYNVTIFSYTVLFLTVNGSSTHNQIGSNIDNRLQSMLREQYIKAVSGDNIKLDFHYKEIAIHELMSSLGFLKTKDSKSMVLSSTQALLGNLVDQLQCGQNSAKPILLQTLIFIGKFVEVLKDSAKYDSVVAHILNKDCDIVSNIFKILHCGSFDTQLTVLSMQTLVKIFNVTILSEHRRHFDLKMFSYDFKLYKSSLIEEKLNSDSWEVRDTALELSYVILKLYDYGISPTFSSFNSETLNKILYLARNDESGYVRASAWNFFVNAVKLSLFGDTLHFDELLQFAMVAVLEDEMPVARKSACDLISALHVPTALHGAKVYEVLFTVTSKDLDWEVRTCALQFWQSKITKLIVEMESSPERFIQVTMDEDIANKIASLKKLGDIGCLKIIWLCLNDECDIKVSQMARDIVVMLEKLGEKWNIIEEVLNLHDGDEESENIEVPSRRMGLKDFFCKIKNENWREVLRCREEWIENSCDNLESLFDHILIDDTVGDCDHNAIDCY